MKTRRHSGEGNNMMMAVTRRGLAPLAAVAFLASAAGGGTAVAADNTLKIGAPLALTGALADEGKKQKLVWDLWIDKVNAAGGIDVGGKKMKVELISYDYQTDGTPRRPDRRKADYRRQGRLDLGAVRLRPHQDRRCRWSALPGSRSWPACRHRSRCSTRRAHYLFGTLSPNGGMTDAMVKFFKAKMPNR